MKKAREIISQLHPLSQIEISRVFPILTCLKKKEKRKWDNDFMDDEEGEHMV